MRALLFCLCLLVIFVSETTAADENITAAWQEVRDAEGIQVLAQDGKEAIHKVKAVTVVDANIDVVKAVIDAAAGHPDWVPYLVETRILRQASDTEALLYSRFDAPWPARDRDFVYRSVVSRTQDGVVTYRLASTQSDLMPERDDHVRAVLMEGVYRLVPLERSKTRMEFMFHADPRGRLPLWIVNMVEHRFPFEALLGLRRVLTQLEPAAARRIPGDSEHRLARD